MNLAIILFLESLGGGELMVILLFVLLFFGSKNIPSLARGLGKGIREFKDAMNGVQSEIKQGMYEIERQTNVLAVEEKEAVKGPVQEQVTTEEPPLDFQKDSPELKPEDRTAAR